MSTRTHSQGPRISNWVLGLAILLILVVGSYVAYTKELPFSSKGYTLSATFENAATLRTTSPVRIAGVNVGAVTSVEQDGDLAKVTFTVDDEGQPIHEDAQLEIRPRLFLEGNFFLDLQPGSPSAPEIEDGGAIGITQTSTAVQLDEVLTALQSDSREDLQVLLEGYGTALTYEPTPADDKTQDKDVQGETAAESINDSFEYGGPAGRDTAIVNEALLGTEPHDLSKLIKAQRDTLGKLTGSEAALQGLITNFNVTTGALADEQA
ncbi:MAG: MlaD family protein, partial [Solirubrobacterales bacterium]